MDLNVGTLSRLRRGGSDAVERDGSVGGDSQTGLLQRLRATLAKTPWFVWTVVLPTVCVALYYLVFAADQYVSEAQFLVRGPQPQSISLLGQVLGSSALHQATEETGGVEAFLTSHDAVSALQRKLDLKEMFRKTGLDFLGRLRSNPTPEDLLGYYRKHVKVATNTNTGVTTLSVRAFDPDDSKRISEELLEQSEQLVNRFSARAEADALKIARNEVDQAEGKLLNINQELTRFRNDKGAIDPAKSSALLMQEVSTIDTQLSTETAKLAQMRANLHAGAPDLKQQEIKVASLQGALNSKRATLTGGKDSMAPVVGDYERLSLEQEFANKEYTSALASLEAARLDAQRQHLYLVRVVEPNRAEKSLYPARGLAILTVFVSLCVAYGIGWLILAGIREHAA
jgi:capsular polysaccharide transport system permease protein